MDRRPINSRYGCARAVRVSECRLDQPLTFGRLECRGLDGCQCSVLFPPLFVCGDLMGTPEAN